MFTKTTFFDTKCELRTFVLLGVLSCFVVSSPAYAGDTDEETSTLIDQSGNSWLKEDSGESSAWYGLENTDNYSSGATTFCDSVDTACSGITPKDISLSLSGGGEITRTYDGTSGTTQQLDDLYHIGDGNNVGGLTGEITGGEITGYNTGYVVEKDNVGGLVGYNDGSTSNNVLNWESFDVAGGGQLTFDKGIGTLVSNGVEDGTMDLGNRHDGSVASVSQFSVAASGRSVFVTGAKIGGRCVLLNAQGRIVASARVVSASFVVEVPRAGTYFVRVDGGSRQITVR